MFSKCVLFLELKYSITTELNNQNTFYNSVQ